MIRDITIGSVTQQLPKLGFSLNGPSLAGPVSPTHLSELASFDSEVWARVGFSSDGTWQTNVDTLVDPIRTAGLKLLLRASFPGNQYSGAVALDTVAYGNFVEALATYIQNKGIGPNDVVFEYPNEINSTSITGAQYAAAAQAAYPKIKGVNANYKVIGASENVYTGNWQSWLTACFNAGFLTYSDGVSFHNYDVAGDHTKYTFLRSQMSAQNALDKMVWISEFGVPTPPNPSGNPLGGQTPAKQAELLVANLLDMGSISWISHAFIYCDLDIPSRSGTNEGWFGIYTNDSSWVKTPKPAVQAIKNIYFG